MRTIRQTSRDPVCGMEVSITDSRFHTAVRNSTYHFCSAHCLERFSASPGLYTSTQRIADIKPIMKRRRLKFLPTSAESTRSACDSLLNMMGVTGATPVGNDLVVEYDLR